MGSTDNSTAAVQSDTATTPETNRDILSTALRHRFKHNSRGFRDWAREETQRLIVREGTERYLRARNLHTCRRCSSTFYRHSDHPLSGLSDTCLSCIEREINEQRPVYRASLIVREQAPDEEWSI